LGGINSKRKGNRTELEFAKLVNGKRVPLSGALADHPGDVEGMGMVWECKVRKEGFKTLYGWLSKEGVDALALKANWKLWLVVFPFETFKRIHDEAQKWKTKRNVWHKEYKKQKQEKEELLRTLDTHVKTIRELRMELSYLKRQPSHQFENSTLAERLQKVRKLRKMSHEDIIKRFVNRFGYEKVTQNQLVDWENGVGIPDLEHIVLLGQFLDVSTRYLESGLLECHQDQVERSWGARNGTQKQ
jgi:5'-3' exonuclease